MTRDLPRSRAHPGFQLGRASNCTWGRAVALADRRRRRVRRPSPSPGTCSLCRAQAVVDPGNVLSHAVHHGCAAIPRRRRLFAA